MNEMCGRLQRCYKGKLERAECYSKDIYASEIVVREYLAQAELLTGILREEFDIDIFNQFVEDRVRIMDIYRSIEPQRIEHKKKLAERHKRG